MAEVGGDVAGRNCGKSFGKRLFQCSNGARLELAEFLFELCPALLDGIEIGRIRRQVAEGGPGIFNQLADAIHFVSTEIIEHDQLTGFQLRAENVLHISQKHVAIGGSFDAHCRHPARCTDCAQQSQATPAAGWHAFPNAFASQAAAIAPRHFRSDTTLVYEDQAFRIDLPRRFPPEIALRPDTLGSLLGGVQ
jgi:hypothetical protein